MAGDKHKQWDQNRENEQQKQNNKDWQKYTIIVIISTTKIKMCLNNDLNLSAPSKKDKYLIQQMMVWLCKIKKYLMISKTRWMMKKISL